MVVTQHVVFKDLRPRTDYGFQVRAKTMRGWGEYSPVIFKTPSSSSYPDSGELNSCRANGRRDVIIRE